MFEVLVRFDCVGRFYKPITLTTFEFMLVDYGHKNENIVGNEVKECLFIC